MTVKCGLRVGDVVKIQGYQHTGKVLAITGDEDGRVCVEWHGKERYCEQEILEVVSRFGFTIGDVVSDLNNGSAVVAGFSESAVEVSYQNAARPAFWHPANLSLQDSIQKETMTTPGKKQFDQNTKHFYLRGLATGHFSGPFQTPEEAASTAEEKSTLERQAIVVLQAISIITPTVSTEIKHLE